ncbi:MAG: 3D domain-containing protein [Candidatus Pacebacteria bacterium]|nr:3D domain-containing protein [Candidatus Paceibacterota bacterium]
MKKSVGIVLMAIVFSIGSTSHANAAFFDNTSTWSFDSILQSIQGVQAQTNDSTIKSGSVVSVTNPSDSKAKAKTTVKTYTVSASAYSSSVDETDDTPFITAAGTFTRDGIVAANFLPLGTAIKIPALYGNKIFVVEDRMNSRYNLNVDVWFPSKELAKQFGRKTIKIEVVS